MINYSTNEFRTGLKIILDKEPYEIKFSEFIKPGKGRAFVRVRLRRLLVGSIIERTFKSTDFFESADILDVKLTYIYNDHEFWYFMNKKNFEQIAINIKVIGEKIKWLLDQVECIVTLWRNQPIAVTLPNFVKLQIVDTNPGLKGNTTTSCSKLAKLSTGAIVKVPLFIQNGEIIKIDTRSGEYVSRVK